MSYTNVGNVNIYYEEKGKGDPILFVHGFGCSIYSWRYVAPRISKHHRTISIDLKGFGKSGKPRDQKYSIIDQAKLLSEFIIEKDLNNLTLVGHSMGGGVCLATGVHSIESKSNRLRRIVLIDSIGYKQKIPLFMQILRTPIIGWLSINLLPVKLQTQSILMQVFFNQSLITLESVKAYSEPLINSNGKYAILMSAKHIIPLEYDELTKKYKTINLPILIIWGNEDKIVPRGIGERLHKDLPNSQIQIIDNCGHAPHEEQPEKTIKLICDFMNAG